MRWSYKTVHFSLKKEGFLGSVFLDEAEIEISLNEFGKSGWELVSFMEVNDGLIAVFKQPLASGIPDLSKLDQEDDKIAEQPEPEPLPVKAEPEEDIPKESESLTQEVEVKNSNADNKSGSDDEEGDVGSIRIF